MESGDGGADGGCDGQHLMEEDRYLLGEDTEIGAVEKCDWQQSQKPEQSEEDGPERKMLMLPDADSSQDNGNSDCTSDVENKVEDDGSDKTKDKSEGRDGADVCRDGINNESSLQTNEDKDDENLNNGKCLKLVEHEEMLTQAPHITEDSEVQPRDTDNIHSVMSLHIQNQLGQTNELENSNESVDPEHTEEGNDKEDIESSVSHANDADGTVEGSEREADQAQFKVKSQADDVDQNSSALVDPEFDLPNTCHSESGSKAVGYFPALDNVDFESDEEGQEGHRDAGRGNVGDVGTSCKKGEPEQDLMGNDEETGQRIYIEGTKHRPQESSLENDSVTELVRETVTYTNIDGDGSDYRNTSTDSPRSFHADYPLIYKNYKVCRELKPGVKECLILETGEQYICITKPKSPADESTDPHGVPEVGDADETKQSAVSDYISLHEEESENSDHDVTCVAEDGQQENSSNDGVPIVMDSTECAADLKPQIEKRQADTDMPFTECGMTRAGEDNALSEKQSSLKKPKRVKQTNRFVELQPDTATDNTEERFELSEPEANVNNSSNQKVRDEEENVNENANFRRAAERDFKIRTSYYPSDRSYRTESGEYGSSYDRYMTGSRVHDTSGSRSYLKSAPRGISCRDQTSRDDSWYKEPSTVDSSRLSTRYTHIERGDPRFAGSRSESVTVPKFRTLQDQQVSWLEMFKMIEQQHRTELQSQYLEHQKILQEMQKNMEKELMKQQDTLKQRLSTHREMLEELSPDWQKGQSVNQSWMRHDGGCTSTDCHRSSDNTPSTSISHITLQGVPVALRNPPPISKYHHDNSNHKLSGEIPVKRSLEKELSSPTRPADTSLNLSSQLSIDRDKQLRGGVYSTPMPLAKVKHKHSPRGSKSYDNVHQGESRTGISHNTSSNHWRHDSPGQHVESADISLTESDDVLSPRTRINLRAKHAKHIADLRTYYEKELQEMQQLLAFRNGMEMKGGGDGVTAGERILISENQELRQKCQHLQEVYHDCKIEMRELQQKFQGLEIRAADYAERYNTAQSQVLTLKSRLEELTDFAKDKESTAADLEAKNRKNMESLQLAHKKEKELAESLHSAKNTIQKLVDKYETLEKDNDILKESLAETQEKLYSSRGEVLDANNKLSRLELENKQLKHDVEILKHDLTVARSALTMQTSYEEAYHKTGSQDRGRSAYSSANTAGMRYKDRSSERNSREHQDVRNEVSPPESETDSDYPQSPIMKAERELKKLHQSQDFSPKLQHKFYGTEVPSHYGGPPLTVDRSNKHSVSCPLSSKNLYTADPKVKKSPQGREAISRSSAPSSSLHFSKSPVESLKSSREKEKSSGSRSYRDKDLNRNRLSKKSSGVVNGLTSEQALERIRSGDVVSRPAWEDVFTSMATDRPNSSGYKESLSYTRDQMIKERLENIENLERKYDDLTNEKRKYEAALSKLPGQGHGRERDRLESELDKVDRELGSVRMSLKRYHVLKSTI